ncbi:hypothetical protein IV468_14925 [Enterococcus casseliflavus]|uniref:hypothetical protein n=1 Tax=Enterococcus casseliflavus TaxID=37734 RepID=UPI001E4687DC|nr:hypothetical protein [Enterococcus casseliflavus]MCD5203033.1 hypothetical protein [Enterococcus casseliflavus]
MCTSFIWRKDQVYIAMNFDLAAKFTLSTKDPKKFMILVDGAPSFGINNNGMFINHLMVDACEQVGYRRGKNVVHTVRLITDVLNGRFVKEDLNEFLSEKEIVNVPNHSCHCMISDSKGNCWIVEPGRGTLYSQDTASPYCLMTNFSLIDQRTNCNLVGSGRDRYLIVEELLQKVSDFDYATAFEVLAAVKQSEGNWKTRFSMVYAQKEKTVYYCFDGDFQKIQQYVFG